MTEKNGGKTAGEVLWVGLCDCSTEQAVPVRWLGGLNKIVRNEHRFFALEIAAEILLLFAKDCSVKPDPKGNALHHSIFICSSFETIISGLPL